MELLKGDFFMKLFNMEHGVEKVYVQLIDLMMLLTCGIDIPKSVMEKDSKKMYDYIDMFLENDNNKYQFIGFDDPKAVSFFQSLDWIIDYREYEKMDDVDIIHRMDDINQEVELLKEIYDHMSDDEKIKNPFCFQKYRQVYYQGMALHYLLQSRYGNTSISLPLIPDCDNISYGYDKDSLYILNTSFGSNQLLLSRKDGKSLSSAFVPNQDFIIDGISFIYQMLHPTIDELDELDICYTGHLSNDLKYFIIDYQVNPSLTIQEEDHSFLSKIPFLKSFQKKKNNN